MLRRTPNVEVQAVDVQSDNQQNEEEATKPASNWLVKIRHEQLERERRQNKEREERARRLKLLLDSDSEDDEENFNAKALVGDNLTDFLSRIENHVKAEQKILDAWNDKDELAPARK